VSSVVEYAISKQAVDRLLVSDIVEYVLSK